MQSGSSEAALSHQRFSIAKNEVEPRCSSSYLKTMKMKTLRSLVTQQAPTLAEFLKKWDVNETYHFFKANCQDFVDDAQVCQNTVRMSQEVKFRLPGGGNEMVGIHENQKIVEAMTLLALLAFRS